MAGGRLQGLLHALKAHVQVLAVLVVGGLLLGAQAQDRMFAICFLLEVPMRGSPFQMILVRIINLSSEIALLFCPD